jgi:hypothetical protein
MRQDPKGFGNQKMGFISEFATALVLYGDLDCRVTFRDIAIVTNPKHRAPPVSQSIHSQFYF